MCIHDEYIQYFATVRNENELFSNIPKRIIEELLRYLFILAKESQPKDDVDNEDADLESTPAPLKLNPFYRLIVLHPRLYARICDSLLDLAGNERGSHPCRILPYEQ